MAPLDFLLGIMRDPNLSSELRIRVAQAAAPFIHSKPGTARSSDPAASAKPIDGVCDFTIDPVLAQLEQFGGGFYDFAIADASRIKGLDCARD
jgi:hypothetical protein